MSVSEKNMMTQIVFMPDIEAIDELGVNWYNVVLDIVEYLESQGFHYSRTLGFVNDRELSEEELAPIAEQIVDLALGADNLLHLSANTISNVQELTSPLLRED